MTLNGEPVTLKQLSIEVKGIIDMDETNQQISMVIVSRVWFTDPRLSWLGLIDERDRICRVRDLTRVPATNSEQDQITGYLKLQGKGYNQ
jgi:hypothetical protein